MTSLILLSILSQLRFLHLTSFWQGIDVLGVPFLRFWRLFSFHYPLNIYFAVNIDSFDVTFLYHIRWRLFPTSKRLFLMSRPTSEHKRRSPEGCNSLRSFSFYGYSVVFACVSTLVNIFQPKRIARVFSLGEYGYFLASVEKNICNRRKSKKSRLAHST